jgi:hypothetical protein
MQGAETMGKVIAGLTNAHPLHKSRIDRCVAKGWAGVYVLGRQCDQGFVVEFVGRSDDCLNRQLHEHARAAQYSHFAVIRCGSAREASDWECALWRALGVADTLPPPTPPDVTP